MFFRFLRTAFHLVNLPVIIETLAVLPTVIFVLRVAHVGKVWFITALIVSNPQTARVTITMSFIKLARPGVTTVVNVSAGKTK